MNEKLSKKIEYSSEPPNCIYCGGHVGYNPDEEFFDSNGYQTDSGAYAHYWTVCNNQERPKSKLDIEYREFWREMINPRYIPSYEE